MLLCSIVRIQHHAIRWKASQRATRRISIQVADSLAMSRQISPASLHWLCWRTGPPARSLEKRSYWNDLEWTEQKNILVPAECFTSWVLHIPILSTALNLIKQQQVAVFEFSPQTVWPHWGVLTVSVKAWCSVEVVSGVSGHFPVISALNGSCEMSMCISTAQARTKRVSRH